MSIGITFRDDVNGKGAFFDHYTIQNITSLETRIVRSDDMDTAEFDRLVGYRRNRGTFEFPVNPDIPQRSDDFGREALFLIVPGRPRKVTMDRREIIEAREAFERRVIELRTRG